MGSAFSEALEHWDPEKTVEWYQSYWAEHEPMGEYTQYVECETVKLLATHYTSIYSRHEREIELGPVEINGLDFTGYIDGRIDSTRLVEDKLKSQWTPAMEEALQASDQLLGYVALYSNLNGLFPEDVVVSHRVTRKPALRPRKSDDDASFLARIKEDIEKREDWYFNEVEVQFTPAQVADWWDSTNQVAALMQFSEHAESWPKNTNSCQQFNGLCTMWEVCTARDTIEREAVISDNFEIRERNEDQEEGEGKHGS